MRRPTLTIGIPAYNEAENIEALLVSILAQTQRSCRIMRIVVLCDGCTDDTVSKVRTMAKRYNRISIMVGSKRKGKAYRMNQLFAQSTADYLILFDGDIVLSHEHVCDQLIETFSKKKHIGLVSGHGVPVRSDHLFGQIMDRLYWLWLDARRFANKGEHIYNCQGAALAIVRDLYQQLRLPADIVADQHFIFLRAYECGFRYYPLFKEVFRFRSPQNHRDFLMQAARSLRELKRITTYFGPEISRAYHIPLYLKVRAVLRNFMSDPIRTSLGIGYLGYLRIHALFQSGFDDNGLWKSPVTTKQAIGAIHEY